MILLGKGVCRKRAIPLPTNQSRHVGGNPVGGSFCSGMPHLGCRRTCSRLLTRACRVSMDVCSTQFRSARLVTLKLSKGNIMQYAILLLLVAAAAFLIDGKFVIGSVLFGVFALTLICPKLSTFRNKSDIPKLAKNFDTYGKYMADYKMYTASCSQYGWIMPGRKAIELVDKFLQSGRADIPINMLCEGIEEDFKGYDKNGGMTPILSQKMEARLRLLSAIAQSTQSESLKTKISFYIKEAEF